MLKIAADLGEFPCTGATAYLKGTAAPRRIIQLNADGTATVELLRPGFMSSSHKLDWHARGASLTRRDNVEDLFETPEQAILLDNARPIHRRARRGRK